MSTINFGLWRCLGPYRESSRPATISGATDGSVPKRNLGLAVNNCMSIWPVIARELKAQARQPWTYWLRVVGGALVATAFAVASWNLRSLEHPVFRSAVQNPVNAFGTALFGKLNLLIFLAIWVFVPLSTADAISRERREGTLALLFLTQLHSWGIVVGKATAHILRALSLLLTMGPWLMLPVLFGGVELKDVGLALMLNSIAVLLALAAGLLASTIPRDWLKAVILAELLALVLFMAMLRAHERVLLRAMNVGVSAPTATTLRFGGMTPGMIISRHLFGYSNSSGTLRTILQRIQVTTDSSIEMSQQWFGGPTPIATMETHWQTIWTNLTPPGQLAWFRGVAWMGAQAVGALLVALFLAAGCVRRSWRDPLPSTRILQLKQTFLSPRFQVALLRRKLSRSLSANPIGWLQHYSPAARLVKWGWCFFVLVVEIFFSLSATDLYDAQAGLGLVLLLGLAFSATASFRNEMETGAFELLLVTPLRERQIIFGRLRGLWNQFFPALAIYGTGSIYLTSGWASNSMAREAWLALAGLAAAFCVLPMIGLYFSVHRLNFFVAWLAACIVGLAPASLARAFGMAPHVVFLIQLSLGLIAGFLLERRLRNRGFLAGSR